MKKQILFFWIVLISANSLNAQVVLPKFFSDNMVLQRETPIPIWGTAKANEKIKVYFNKQISKTKADKSGNWKVFLKPEKAGGPYLLTIVGSDKYKIKNVLVGDVWICSGQSNMEWSVAQSDNFQYEKKTADIPFIRQIKV